MKRPASEPEVRDFAVGLRLLVCGSRTCREGLTTFCDLGPVLCAGCGDLVCCCAWLWEYVTRYGRPVRGFLGDYSFDCKIAKPSKTRIAVTVVDLAFLVRFLVVFKLTEERLVKNHRKTRLA